MSIQPVTTFDSDLIRSAGMSLLFALRGAAVLGIVAVIVGFWGETNWVADLLAQLRVQWAIGLLVLVLLLALTRSWLWMLVCVVFFAINAIPIWPYVAGFGAAVNDRGIAATDSDADLRLMSLNVLTQNRNWDEVVASIQEASPDFLILMEIDSAWQQICEAQLAEAFPHIVFEAREDNFGIAFLSKLPWSQLEVFNSRTLQLPSIDVTISGASEKPLRIIATHPIPPIQERKWKARNEQLIDVAQRFDATTCNLMVGDFNLTPWSPNFKKVVAAANLKDAGQRFGITPTWYVFPTWIGGLKIDHALLSTDLTVKDLQFGQDVGSDHRALILDFDF